MSESTIHVIDQDADHQAWDDFVERHPRGSLYHLARWRTVITNVFGQEQIYLQATNDEGAITGVLPMVRQKSRIFGHRLLSMPYFNYGGPLGETEEIETALMEHAGGIALQSGATSIEFRDMFRRTGDWPCRDEKLLMILELPAAPEELFKALGTKRRTRIRRAKKENPEIRRGGIELLEDFYTVFAITMRDLGTPVYAPRFFREMLEAFPDKAQIVSIRLDGEPVSAGFLLGHGDMMQIPWAGTLRKANRLAMNMLLYWDIIENTIERGFARFDFGRTTVDSGTHEFKKQWGAQPHQMHWHYWVAPGQERPQLNPDNPRYKRAISIWQKLPVPVTRLIGPHLVKNLP